MNPTLVHPIAPTSVTPGVQSALRILFVGESVSLAHVGRPTILARWAREAGHHVDFACGKNLIHIPASEGLPTRTLTTINPDLFYKRIRSGAFFYTRKEMMRYVKEEMGLINDVQPDLIVGDFRLTLAISAACLNIPFVPLINAYWSPGSACAFPPPNSGIARLLPLPLRKRFFNHIRPIAFKTFAQPLNAVRKAFSLAPYRDFREHFTAGTACAYLDLPDWIKLSHLPKQHFFIGPVIWKANNSEKNLSPFPCKQPSAYVSMGSSGKNELLPTIFSELIKRKINIIGTGIKPEEQAKLYSKRPELKKHAQLFDVIDPSLALQQAAIAICHGGSGTIYQALQAGVPTLCFPLNSDQTLASEALQAHGAGLSLPAEIANAQSISDGLTKMLSPTNPSVISMKDKAKLVSNRINNQETRKRWNGLLTQFNSVRS